MTVYKAVTSIYGSQYIIHRTRYENQEMVIRLADHTDYHHMLVVSPGIYSGMDYMPAKYHWLLDTGNVFMFMLFLDDTPAGFLIYVIRDEYSVFGLAGRISASLRGSGMMAVLSHFTKKFLIQNFPKMKWEMGVGLLTKARQSGMNKVEAVQILAYNAVTFESTFSILQKTENLSPPATNVKQIPPTELSKIFDEQPSELTRMFKNNHFCAGRPIFMYDLNREDFTKAAHLNQVLVSYQDSSSPSQLNAISFMCSFRIPVGTMLMFHYHGAEDFTVLRSHILKSLTLFNNNNNISKSNGDVRFMLNFPKAIPVDVVVDYIENNDLGKRENSSAKGPTIFDATYWDYKYGFDRNSAILAKI